jgi:hypothetical protein
MNTVSNRFLLKRLCALWQLSRKQCREVEKLGSDIQGELLILGSELHKLFPNNPEMVSLWPTTEHWALGGRSPMDVITEKGMSGVREVRRLMGLAG